MSRQIVITLPEWTEIKGINNKQFADLLPAYDELLNLIKNGKPIEQEPQWHDSEEPPKEGEYILLSFSNFSLPLVGRYEGGAYYIGDDLTTALSQDIYVNGWQELPKCREK